MFFHPSTPSGDPTWGHRKIGPGSVLSSISSHSGILIVNHNPHIIFDSRLNIQKENPEETIMNNFLCAHNGETPEFHMVTIQKFMGKLGPCFTLFHVGNISDLAGMMWPKPCHGRLHAVVEKSISDRRRGRPVAFVGVGRLDLGITRVVGERFNKDLQMGIGSALSLFLDIQRVQGQQSTIDGLM